MHSLLLFRHVEQVGFFASHLILRLRQNSHARAILGNVILAPDLNKKTSLDLLEHSASVVAT